MRLEATVYRSEDREFAEGERVQVTRSDWDQGISVGNPATIEQIHECGGISERVDSGASLQLTPERAQHVDYGYAIESIKHLAVDRIILSSETEQITAQREALSLFSTNLCEIVTYPLDGSNAAPPSSLRPKETAAPAIAQIIRPESEPSSIEFEAYAMELQ